MIGKLIRILACAALGLMATQASAESNSFSVEYRWLTSLDVLGTSVQIADPDQSYTSTTFMRLMVKPFMKLDPTYGLGESDLTTVHFRRADPEFGIPQAFRRQQQMRLGFSIRF